VVVFPGVFVSQAGSRRRRRLPLLLATVVLFAGCGSAATTRSTATVAATSGPGTGATSTPSASCGQLVAGTLGTVAARVYHEAATGGDVEQAVHRVQSSSALASAVNSDDASAARAALRELLLGQIVRIEVLRGGHVLAQAGSGQAIAPAQGSIPGTDATFVLSTQAEHSYVEVVRQVTGAKVTLTTNPTATPGSPGAAPTPTGYQATTLSGLAYPRQPLRIALLVPTAGVSCPGSATRTKVETLGRVGELIYQEELHSPDVAKTVRHIEASEAFREAVAARDPSATRDAIVGFFREHIHVVRVLVTTSAGLLVDVGGPYVPAPVRGTVRSHGKVVGKFEMAIQDDAGYMKLAHLFTGAEVLMREGERQVMGTLTPGPPTVPDRGTVAYGGGTYEAYSFTGEAFPEGPLRISLLLAA
jgi:hypothetical protein